MSKAVFDKVTGQFWAYREEDVTADDPRAVAMKVPANTAAWRLSYDTETKKVVVRYPGMTDEEAEAQMEQDLKPPPAPVEEPAA